MCLWLVQVTYLGVGIKKVYHDIVKLSDFTNSTESSVNDGILEKCLRIYGHSMP